MRIALIGAGDLSVSTAKILLGRGHDVVVIDEDRERLESLSDELDAGFIHGDGSRPAILEELDPSETDVLFCLTGDDHANILAALVGRSLGFERVVPQIHDPGYEHICNELGLSETIIPDDTIARTLADSVEGRDVLQLSTIIRGEVRFHTFTARREDEGPVSELGLPEKTRPICVYRDDGYLLPDDETELREDDEVVLLTHAGALDELERRWG